MQVKQTGIGVNGQPVLFYLPRKHKAARERPANDTNLDYFTMKLFGLLKNIGATLSKKRLRTILKTKYPNGYPGWPIAQTELTKFSMNVGDEHKNDIRFAPSSRPILARKPSNSAGFYRKSRPDELDMWRIPWCGPEE